MSAAPLIYLASVVNGLLMILMIMFVPAVFLSCVGICLSVDGSGNDGEIAKGLLKKCVPIALIVGILYTITPSKETVYLMAGAHVSQQIIEAPETKEIGGKILTILNQKLDEQLEKK